MKKLLFLILLTTPLLFLNLTGFTQNLPSYVPTNGLVGWYPFSGNSNDESGNGNHGVNNGGVLDVDKNGNQNSSYYFDGYSGIQIPNSSLNSDFTISFWMNPNVGSYVYYPIELSSSMVGDLPGIGISGNNPPCGNNIDTSIVYLFDGENGCGNILMTTNKYSNNQFPLVVVSRQDTSYRITIDGNSIFDDTTLNFFNIDSIQIGKRVNGYGFRGIVDDVGIWNRYLSGEEIESLYGGSCQVYDTITTLDTIRYSVTDTLYIDVNLTSTIPLVFENTIKIYPNPTKDFLQIDCGDISTMNGYSIKIINSLSQSLFDEPVTQSPFSIDMNGWNGNGLYFLHLIDDSGNITDIRKIVLQ